MELQSAVETLSELLRASADDSVRVEQISAAADSSRTRTEMTLAVPFEAGAAAEEVTVTDCAYVDGTIQFDVSLSVDSNDAVAPDESAPASENDSSVDNEDASDDEIPAYKDPDRLRAVYEAHDSFTEMQAALDVDVTAQTVRRNMIKEGIHVPETNENTDSEGDAEAEAEASEKAEKADSKTDTVTGETVRDTDAEPDEDTETSETAEQHLPTDEDVADVALPDGITIEAVRDAVAESSSLHGAQMALGLDMKETRQLLQELDVLEYVGGRIANRDADIDPTEIERTITRSMKARADGSGHES